MKALIDTTEVTADEDHAFRLVATAINYANAASCIKAVDVDSGSWLVTATLSDAIRRLPKEDEKRAANATRQLFSWTFPGWDVEVL